MDVNLPITFKEFWTTVYVLMWVIPLGLGLWFWQPYLLIGLIFPICFYPMFHFELDWTWRLHFKWFERRERNETN